MNKLLRYFLHSLLWLLLIGLALFGSAGIYFCSPLSPEWRIALSAIFSFAVLGPCLLARTWKHSLAISGFMLVIFFGWYISIEPKMNADWGKDVAVLPNVDFQGDLMIVKNIRNFNYRSDTDFDVQYYDKVYDLRQLKTVDLFLCYWGTTRIAHTIMSFGFANGEYLAISIETRKKIGEEYSAIQGFFKKFELTYIVADERDLIGVRVNHRNEDVYLYRLKPNPVEVRKILTDYMKSVDDLEHTPEFYNALTTNCTTSILPHIRAAQDLKFNWAMLENGYIDRWRYDAGVWGFDIPFEEFRRRSHINEKVKTAGNGPEFSTKIREGLPSIRFQSPLTISGPALGKTPHSEPPH